MTAPRFVPYVDRHVPVPDAATAVAAFEQALHDAIELVDLQHPTLLEADGERREGRGLGAGHHRPAAVRAGTIRGVGVQALTRP
jgi:hypothetical protein